MRICDRCGVKEAPELHENLVITSIAFEDPIRLVTSWKVGDLCQECANLFKDAVMELKAMFEPKLH